MFLSKQSKNVLNAWQSALLTGLGQFLRKYLLMQIAVLPLVIVSASHSCLCFIILIMYGEFGLKHSSMAFVTAWRSCVDHVRFRIDKVIIIRKLTFIQSLSLPTAAVNDFRAVALSTLLFADSPISFEMHCILQQTRELPLLLFLGPHSASHLRKLSIVTILSMPVQQSGGITLGGGPHAPSKLGCLFWAWGRFF